jgi:hypothetical protein
MWLPAAEMDGDANNGPKNGDWALAFPHSEHHKPKAEATERGTHTLFRKNTTGAARSQEQPPGRWPMFLPNLNRRRNEKSYGHQSLQH